MVTFVYEFVVSLYGLLAQLPEGPQYRTLTNSMHPHEMGLQSNDHSPEPQIQADAGGAAATNNTSSNTTVAAGIRIRDVGFIAVVTTWLQLRNQFSGGVANIQERICIRSSSCPANRIVCSTRQLTIGREYL